MTNYEWLLQMSGEERQAWFDAPHADCEQVDSGANISIDTRTLIIADVNAWIESNVGFSIWASDLREHVIGWLDRQAAITERETNWTCNNSGDNVTDSREKQEVDSQEKLDVDLRGLLLLLVDDVAKTAHEQTFDKFLKVDAWWNAFARITDRQAAITQAQIFKRLPKQQVSQESFESVIDDMSTEIELLTSERDNLAKDLADSVDQLSAERERFREVTSTILDAVHAIELTANKYWNE